MKTGLAEVAATPAANISIRVERNALVAALAHVQGVVERRNTIPILGNVKLETSASQLRLTATDMDMAVTDVIAANVDLEGALTVPALTFYDIVRKLPEGTQVELRSGETEGRLQVTCGSSKFTLPTLPVDDFPDITVETFTHTFTMPSVAFLSLVEKTKFAMSSEETRYYLNGIYLHAVGEGDTAVMRAVATDGHRLARNEVPLPAGAGGMPGIIVPRKTVLELAKLFETSDEPLQLGIAANKIRLSMGPVTLVSKLVDGTFPDYGRVIPSGNDKLMEVSPKALSVAVDRVATISSDRVRGIRLTLEPGKLTLTSNSVENGSGTESVDVSYSADTIEVGFNSRYLLDMLDQIEGDVAQLVFADSISPVLVRDTGDLGVLYVIMPMRI